MTKTFSMILLLGAAGCGGSGGSTTMETPEEPLPAAPAEWTERDSGCGFTLRAPRELEEVAAEPVDSCVFLLENQRCHVSADYGGYSNDLEFTAEYPEYASSQVFIDGREASVVTVAMLEDEPHPYVAAVHFPEVDPAAPGLKLTVWTACTTRPERDALKPLLGTIRFAPH
jgi:hypothetical protein